MEEVQKVNFTKKNWLNVIWLFLKIVFVGVICWCMTVSVIFAVKPLAASKIFNFFGNVRAEETCYKYDYEKSESAPSLYNLILFEQAQQKYEEELYYLNLLFARDDYDEFCAKLDASALKQLEDKSLIVFAASTHTFIVNQMVSSMQKSGVSDLTIINYIKGRLTDGNREDYALMTYLNLIIQSQPISSEDKISKVQSLYADEDLKIKLDSKISQIETKLSGEESGEKKIILAYNLMKNLEAKYRLFSLNEDEQTEAVQAEYKSATNNYYALTNE